MLMFVALLCMDLGPLLGFVEGIFPAYQDLPPFTHTSNAFPKCEHEENRLSIGQRVNWILYSLTIPICICDLNEMPGSQSQIEATVCAIVECLHNVFLITSEILV
jgi:hypothetical protein